MDPYDLEPDSPDRGQDAEHAADSVEGHNDDLISGPPPSPSQSGTVETGYWCGGCGYALEGLPFNGQCPECGLSVRQSLAGDLLRDAGPQYVESLRRGATLVLVSLVASFSMQIIGLIAALGFAAYIGVSAAGGAAPAAMPAMSWITLVQTLFGLVGVAFSIVGLVGWWKLSTHDPRHGPTQQGTARQVVRVAVTVVTATSLASVVLQPFFGSVGAAMPGAGIMVVAIGIGIISVAAGATMFFAAMLYIKGLAVRIPDHELESRARTFIWLLPLIYVLGSCIVVGPLIALVMYAWLINRVRISMIAILRDQALDKAMLSEQPGGRSV